MVEFSMESFMHETVGRQNADKLISVISVKYETINLTLVVTL